VNQRRNKDATGREGAKTKKEEARVNKDKDKSQWREVK
jgi:hypothetical protein